MKVTSAEKLMREAGLTQQDVGQALGIDGSAVCNKFAGRRRWYREEIDKFLSLVSKKLGRTVSYEETSFVSKARRERAAVAR